MSQAKGASHVETLRLYLQAGGEIPVSANGGIVNVAELVRLTGIPRSCFYQNEKLEAKLDAELKSRNIKRSIGLVPAAGDKKKFEGEDKVDADLKSESKLRRLEKKLHQLEQQNSGVVAENAELRRQVKDLRLQLGRDDLQIESGRRVLSPAELK